MLRGARHAIAWHTSTAHLCKSTLRFGRRKTIVHRTMCALPEAISAGGLTPSWYIYFKSPLLKCRIDSSHNFIEFFYTLLTFPINFLLFIKIIDIHLSISFCICYYNHNLKTNKIGHKKARISAVFSDFYVLQVSNTRLHFSYVIFNCHAYSKIIQKFSWNRLKTSFFRLLLSVL